MSKFEIKDEKSYLAKVPNLLIISNMCLSQSSSNGRTLRNFLIGWPMKNIAQFYIKPGTPDFSVCEKYLCITDSQAAKAFLGKKTVAQRPNKSDSVPADSSKKQMKRNAVTMLAREVAWNSRRWMTSEFDDFVESFSPDILLLQAGDCGFMCSLAKDLAQKYDIPLVVYNSESYYFNNFNYFLEKEFTYFSFKLFRHNFRRRFEQMMRVAAKTVYICDSLQKAYDDVFHAPSETIYTATEMTPGMEHAGDDRFTVTYLGNLGLGRHKSLMEIAETLHTISEDIYLDVYGSAKAAVQQELEQCPAVRYHGVVSYDEVQRIMRQSSLLVHAESFENAYRKSLQFAFSTKIPDSLASGTCFLLYAPEEMACTKYLKEHEAAYVVSDKENLKPTLELLVQNSDAREKYISTALQLAAENHNAEKNANRFQAILKQAVIDKNEGSTGKLRI